MSRRPVDMERQDSGNSSQNTDKVLENAASNAYWSPASNVCYLYSYSTCLIFASCFYFGQHAKHSLFDKGIFDLVYFVVFSRLLLSESSFCVLSANSSTLAQELVFEVRKLETMHVLSFFFLFFSFVRCPYTIHPYLHHDSYTLHMPDPCKP